MLVLTDELTVFCARMLAGRLNCPLSVSQYGQLSMAMAWIFSTEAAASTEASTKGTGIRGQPSPKVTRRYSGQRQSWKTPGELGVSKSIWSVIFSLQCFDTVSWVEGHPACKKTGCWFVGGDELTLALHDF